MCLAPFPLTSKDEHFSFIFVYLLWKNGIEFALLRSWLKAFGQGGSRLCETKPNGKAWRVGDGLFGFWLQDSTLTDFSNMEAIEGVGSPV